MYSLNEYQNSLSAFNTELKRLLCDFLVNIFSLQNYLKNLEQDKNKESYFNLFKNNYLKYIKDYYEKIDEKLTLYSDIFLKYQENLSDDSFYDSSEKSDIISNMSLNDYKYELINKSSHFISGYNTFIDNDNDNEIASLKFDEKKKENQNIINNIGDKSFKTSLYNSSLFNCLNVTEQNYNFLNDIVDKNTIEKKIKTLIDNINLDVILENDIDCSFIEE